MDNFHRMQKWIRFSVRLSVMTAFFVFSEAVAEEQNPYTQLCRDIRYLHTRYESAVKAKEGTMDRTDFQTVMKRYQSNAKLVQKVIAEQGIGEDIDFVQAGHWLIGTYRAKNQRNSSKKKAMLEEENMVPTLIFKILKEDVAALKKLNFRYGKPFPISPKLKPYLPVLEYKRLFDFYVSETKNMQQLTDNYYRRRLLENRMKRMIVLAEQINAFLDKEHPDYAFELKLKLRTEILNRIFVRLSVGMKAKSSALDEYLKGAGSKELEAEREKHITVIKNFLEKDVVEKMEENKIFAPSMEDPKRLVVAQKADDSPSPEETEPEKESQPKVDPEKEISALREAICDAGAGTDCISPEQFEEYKSLLPDHYAKMLEETYRNNKTKGYSDDYARRTAVSKTETDLKVGRYGAISPKDAGSILTRWKSKYGKQKPEGNTPAAKDPDNDFIWK